MPIRPAKFGDVPRIVELLVEMHGKSRYDEVDEVDEGYSHKLIAQCVQRHGGTTDGGSLVYVAERDGVVEGMMVGTLDRTYHIGKKLRANDVFLYCSDRAFPADFMKLFGAYAQWALNNPRVVEVWGSWTDAVPGAERIEGLYQKHGFRRCGAVWSKTVYTPAMAEGVEA